MPTPKQAEIRGTDVQLQPRMDVRDVHTYRVADDGTVYIACEFHNWKPFATSSGVKPGGKWTQYRRLTAQNGPTAREARRMAELARQGNSTRIQPPRETCRN